ncbi:lactate utilization protein [Brucepastera parasyntrophica]|uniref:lactate utilization protein n=1 Tax=Brucepastera parasyntrophica TaxID=2880008 RepID=UPI00210A7E88|nr:lactate utilization protein [Brucepastera parasyntrophica]ULQ60328.1 lactate utilization protein [Brucepastera parasyntrophica]
MDYTDIRKNFEKHGFSTQVFLTKEEAADYLKNELQHQTIGFGGSETLREIGLFEALLHNNAVVWHNKVPSRDVRRLANCANIYITSANAVTKSGEIVNIDATGNRVAMTAFGPGICYYVVGKNKITENMTDAIYRCRNVAAPQNAKRVNAKTPCAKKADRCYDCNSPDRICRIMITIDRVPKGMKCEVIFIDQELGF